MLEEHLVQTCYKVTVARNKYSDYQEVSRTAVSCRFREISTKRREAHAEIRDADAMLWVAPDEDIARGDIIWFESIYYQIERLINARRLGETDTQFLKFDLEVVNIGLS